MKITKIEARLLRNIAREFGLKHAPEELVRNYAVSVGRIAVRHFREQDAVNPDVVFLDDEWMPIGGLDNGVVNERMLVDQRTAYYVRRYEDQIRHILDWQRVAVEQRHAWTTNLDDLGRPKKLMKCGSLDDLTREANEQFRRMRHRRHQIAMDYAHEYARIHAAVEQVVELDEPGDDVVLVAELGHGLRLVRLQTPAALDDETERMDHCVGLGGYDYLLKNPQAQLLSVRNADDVSLATAEVHGEVVEQFYGPNNTRPSEHVIDAFRAYMDSQNWISWSEKRILGSQYFRLCRLLAVPLDREDQQRFEALDHESQRSEITLLKIALGLGPDDPIPAPAIEIERLDAMDGQIGMHIMIDENGQPVEVEIDPDAADPFAPRP